MLWRLEDTFKEERTLIVGYAFVVCDLLHYGHLHFFRECKKYCDYLIVGIYTDELTKTYKRKPIIPFNERKELIKELRIIDEVVVVHNRSCIPMLKKLTDKGYKISYVFHGTDWNIEIDKDLQKTKEYIEKLDGKLIQPEYYDKQTTTLIIQKIQRRERLE